LNYCHPFVITFNLDSAGFGRRQSVQSHIEIK
jgi:hypothetical protein